MPEGRLKVGNVEILVISDFDVDFPGPDAWRAHFGGYLLRSQGQTILVDTGLGSISTNPGTVTAFGGGMDGRLMAELQTVGVNPEDVDTVFFTHLHPDHVGWNLAHGGTNPRARFHRAR